MRITRQRSGNRQGVDDPSARGRGEYEICEEFEGLTPSDLKSRRIMLELDAEFVFDTCTMLTFQGGKRRLRRIRSSGPGMQIPRQIAAILLMPKPVRDDQVWGTGTPVMRSNLYGVVNIELSQVRLEGENTAWATVNDVFVGNDTYHVQSVNFCQRLVQVKSTWEQSESFPEEIEDLLVEHRGLASSGEPIKRRVEQIVEELQRAVAEMSQCEDPFYSQGMDVLPALRELLRRTASNRQEFIQ